MKKICLLASAILAASFITFGCGGNIPLDNTQNSFTGRHHGDIVFETGTRGSGPFLQLEPLVVDDAGTLSGTATYLDEYGSHRGQITGVLTPEGKLSLSVKLNSTEFTAVTADKTGLRWIQSVQSRGDKSRYVTGFIQVTKTGGETRPARIYFWNE